MKIGAAVLPGNTLASVPACLWTSITGRWVNLCSDTESSENTDERVLTNCHWVVFFKGIFQTQCCQSCAEIKVFAWRVYLILMYACVVLYIRAPAVSIPDGAMTFHNFPIIKLCMTIVKTYLRTFNSDLRFFEIMTNLKL